MIERTLCPVCGDAHQSAETIARDRMFGLPETFVYAVCARCGSLYLRAVPDHAVCYPAGYYAHRRAQHGIAGRLTAWVRLRRRYAAWSALVGAGVRRDAAILDAGAGAGELLAALRAAGYTSLTGCDPLAEPQPLPRVHFVRGRIEDLAGTWDLVMFDHALEHVSDPLGTVKAALARLRGPASLLLVRIPLVNDAWRTYGADWVQLDAPRHTFVPTASGMDALVAAAGGRIERVVYDSNAFQFWGSEWYRAGRRLDDIVRSPVATFAHALWGELRYGARARRLNRAGAGDQAAFLIRPREQA